MSIKTCDLPRPAGIPMKYWPDPPTKIGQFMWRPDERPDRDSTHLITPFRLLPDPGYIKERQLLICLQRFR